MSPESLALLLAAVLGGGTVASVVNALMQRRKVGADATAVVIAAARELVDPLRQELANERADHAREIAMEQKKVAQLRGEMDAALQTAQTLRSELALARIEADELRRESEAYREKLREQSRRIAELEATSPPDGTDA